MHPFILLGSLQPIANIFGLIGLFLGGFLVYGGFKTATSKPESGVNNVLSFLMLLPGVVILMITAFLLFGEW